MTSRKRKPAAPPLREAVQQSPRASRTATAARDEGGKEFRLVITDSGLGGLAVCAMLERVLRSLERIPGISLSSSSSSSSSSSTATSAESIIRSASPAQPSGPIDAADVVAARLIYVNAWPDERFGYNDLPGAAERARAFDRALEAMERLRPGMILVACNTLSVLYGQTAFSRRTAIPVRGIIEAGADLFAEALAADPGSTLVIFGTRTTIESGAHIERLAEKGVGAGRVSAVACHGLAAAIDDDPDGPEAERLLAACAAEACRRDKRGDAEGAGAWRSDAEHSATPQAGSDDAAGAGGVDTGRGTLYAGLACTHYGWIADAFREELEKRSGRRVVTLDPNERLAVATVDELAGMIASRAGSPRSSSSSASGSGTGIASGGGRDSGEAAAEGGTFEDGLSLRPNQLPGTGTAETRSFITVEVVSKVALDERMRRAAAARLERVSELTAAALLNYRHRPDLF